MRTLLPRATLRVRTVAVSTLLVLGVLLVSVLALTMTVRSVLISTAVDAARVRASELAVLASEGTLPPIVTTTEDEQTLVQVVVDGGVIASSENINGEGPLPTAPIAPGEARFSEVEDLPIGDEDTFELVSRGFSSPTGDGVVHVGVSFETIEEFVDILERLGLAGAPVIALALGAVLWRVVGHTLRPIEEVRLQAASIGGATLDERVPVPPTDDEVARLATTLNAMLARLQDSAVKQERFASDAAHELRSPLASLRVQLESARASTGPVDWGHVSGELLDETLRMQRLTEQLLSLVALLPERIARTGRDVDLDDVVGDVLTQPHGTAPDRVTVTTGGLAPTRVRGVVSLLSLAVRNLVENATAHAAGRVLVTLTVEHGHAVLTVEDDGPGIPDDETERVFDPFVRLDEGRARQQGGAGLGLALVRDVAVAHDGEATASRSQTLHGARMTVRIPLAQR